MAPTNEDNGMTGTPPNERFDDDRLLAYALGLGDDAELEQALAADVALRERLQSVRADLDAVEDQVRAAVPAPEEPWADLSAARWDGLRPYVATRPAPSLRRRRRFGWRVLAPAVSVAAVAALAVGIALSQTGNTTSTSSGGSEFSGNQPSGGAGAGTKTATSVPQAAALAADSAAYHTVVVARAGAVSGGAQQFTVVRTLKGDAGSSVSLEVEVGGALKQGSLALLLLKPNDTLGSSAPTAAPTPMSTPSPSTSPTHGRQVDHLYLYQGTPAEVQPLPAGTDPNSLTLP